MFGQHHQPGTNTKFSAPPSAFGFSSDWPQHHRLLSLPSTLFLFVLQSQFQPLQLQESCPELFWGRYQVLTTLSVLLLPQPQYLVHNQYYVLFFNEHSVNQWINDSLFQGILTCSDELFTCQPPPPHESMRNHVSHLQSSVPETVSHTSWYLMAFSEWMNDWMNEKNFIFLGIIWH